MTENPLEGDTPELPKRFYKDVTVSAGDGTSGGDNVPGTPVWAVQLDGRPVRTPAKALLALPSAKLAEAVAEEWRAQEKHIDPATMPMTRIVNSALDGVTGREAEVRDDIVAFAGTDLVCYRADTPAELVARQAEHWDPVLQWAREELGARFILAEGIMPVEQPPEALEKVASRLDGFGPLALGALHVMTTLTGSALIALQQGCGSLSEEAAWEAAHIDEDFQVAQWGEDAEAAARRAYRKREFLAACRLCAG